MKRLLSTMIVLLSLSFMTYANEQCNLTPVSLNKYTPSAEYVFQNRLSPDLNIYTAIPESTIISGDPILIFKNKKSIGFQKINESFEQNIPMLLKEKWNINCKNQIVEITKKNYQVLIIDDEKTLEGKNRMTVFIIPKNKKISNYFYLISFIGYTHEQTIQMLIKD